MKTSLLLVALLFLSLSILAQDEEAFTRKGKFLIETGGASIFAGIGASTGGGIIINEGSSATQLGLEAGKFVTEDLAIKAKIGVFGGGRTISNFGVGAKHYISGVAPLDIDLGIITGFGSTSFIGGAHIGYAIKAADNIYFEPKHGVVYSEESTITSIKFAFALIL